MIQFSVLTKRVAGKGAGAWTIHHAAARLREAGHDNISLRVGDPDQTPPEMLIDATVCALREHRTGYSATIGYPGRR